MEIIQLNYPERYRLEKDEGPMSLALGFFDGVHCGHQRVIEAAVARAKELGIRSAVMTFDPHPSIVLGSRKEVVYITPLRQKLEILESLGVDVCFVVQFTSNFAKLTPEQFVQHFIKDLHIRHVTAGFDFTFGAFGKGTMKQMEDLGKGVFGVTTVDKHEDSFGKISSTRIRGLLKEGDMEEVCRLLGRPFRITGVVVHGDKRGRTIGFPTANIEPESESYVPGTGVFAVRINVQGVTYNGVCNVGYKPTFEKPGEKKKTIEVHIMDFDQSIYGEEVAVDWFKKLRDEKKFPGIDELKSQIARDKEAAIKYFEAGPEASS